MLKKDLNIKIQRKLHAGFPLLSFYSILDQILVTRNTLFLYHRMAGLLAYSSNAYRRLPDDSVTYWQYPPVYSDEIAQAFHLFPYSPHGCGTICFLIPFSDRCIIARILEKSTLVLPKMITS